MQLVNNIFARSLGAAGQESLTLLSQRYFIENILGLTAIDE
jgi:hypothetical protein